MTLSPGQSLGSYEILSPIGAGLMDEVYEAEDTRLGRTVAIKVLPDGLTPKTRPASSELQSSPSPLRPAGCKRRHSSWAQLVGRIYEVDPLICGGCGAEMPILAFILDPPVTRKILRHSHRAQGLTAT